MKTKAILTPLVAAVALGASAQGYYDDDIYYDASKDTKAKQEIAAHRKAVEEERVRQQQQYEAEMAYWRAVAAQQGNYDPTLGGDDYAAADAYSPAGPGALRDVDEYNRRGAYAPSAAAGDSTAAAGDFTYTRRIERFHNGDIIAEVGDPDLTDYYYSTEQSQPDVNIYLVSPGWSSWWGPSWAYDPWWYDPWWPRSYWSWSYWGPSWSLGWSSWYGWGLGWSWGWGPSWAWGGPCWGWGGHHHGWGGHHPGWGGGWAYSPGHYAPQGRQSTGVRNGYTGLSGRAGSPFAGNRGRAGSSVSRQSLGNYRPGGSSAAAASGSGGSSSGSYRPGSGYAPSKSGSASADRSSSGARRSSRGSSSSSSSYSPSRSSSSSSGSWSGGGGSSRGGGGGGGHSSRGGRR